MGDVVPCLHVRVRRHLVRERHCSQHELAPAPLAKGQKDVIKGKKGRFRSYEECKKVATSQLALCINVHWEGPSGGNSVERGLHQMGRFSVRPAHRGNVKGCLT